MEYVSQIDRSARRQQTAEDFTPPILVNQMLDKLPIEYFKEKKNFLDNSAGNGNIVIEVVRRKINNGLSYIDALETTFAIEILSDNVIEMKQRIKDLVLVLVPTANMLTVDEIINRNIVCHDALDWDYENWCPIPHPIQLALFADY